MVAAISSADKAEFVRALGADEVVLYGNESWGDPVDMVIDGVGGELLGPAVRALAPGGRLVAYSSGGGTVDAYELLIRSASAIGFQMAAIARGEPKVYARWLDELWERHRNRTLCPRVSAEIPLAEAARAHEIIHSRRNLGKVVLVPGARAARLDLRGSGRVVRCRGTSHRGRLPAAAGEHRTAQERPRAGRTWLLRQRGEVPCALPPAVLLPGGRPCPAVSRRRRQPVRLPLRAPRLSQRASMIMSAVWSEVRDSADSRRRPGCVPGCAGGCRGWGGSGP